MFMVAGIYFMKDLLLFTFTKLLIKIKSRSAVDHVLVTLPFLSAFLDALKGDGGDISVALGFYHVTARYKKETISYTSQNEDKKPSR